MIVRVEPVAYGREASDALARAIIDAKGGSPLAPVTVVVPSNFVGLGARRLLGSGDLGVRGVANVSFLTPLRLAQLLASDRLLDTRPLTNPVLGAAVRLALAADPGPFAGVAGHHATETALASLYQELSNTTEEARRRVAGHGRTAAAAVALFNGIARSLGGFHDESAVAHAAADHPRLAIVSESLGRVIWYLPAPLNQPLARMLSIVLTVRESVVLVGLTGDADADEAVLRTCRRAGVPLDDFEAPVPDAPPTASRLVSVTDADEEVREVVRDVVRLAADGVPLDRIGVFYPVPDPYVSTIEQQLGAAGIPANGPSRARLGDSVAGRTLLAALALPAQQWRRDRVLALVGGGPVRHGGEPARPVAWEQVSRRAGVVAGLGDWSSKLTSYAAGLRDDAALEGAGAGRVRALEREAHDADALRTFVAGLASAVEQVRGAAGWRARSAAATALLRGLLGPTPHTWPEAEIDAYERVGKALDRLAELDDLEVAPTFEVFQRALRAELDVTRGRSGRFGHGVVHGPLAGAVGLDLDAVFVLGCAEGLCPSPRREDSLLSDGARELARGDLELRAARLHDQHRAFLAALAAAPTERRTLLFPRGDLRSGREAQPSRWLLDSATALAGRPVRVTGFDELAEPVVRKVPSFAAGLSSASPYADPADRDLAVLAGAVGCGADPFTHPLTALTGRGFVALAARAGEQFSEWDGNVSGQTVPLIGERPISATQLERWAECGFRYFLRSTLGLADRDDPERVVAISPLDRGELLHEVLERFLREVLANGVPAPNEPWSAAQRTRAREIAEEVCDRFERRGRTGRPLLWRSTRADLLAAVSAFLTADDRYRASRSASPEQAEWNFGGRGASHGPLRLELPSGRTLLLQGRADRVDRSGDGTVIVLDYKSNGKDKYKDVEGPDPFMAGRSLQLGVYAAAAEQHLGAPAEARYWMILIGDATSARGYPWDAARRQRFLEVLDVVTAGIEGGVFPAVPGDYDTFFASYEGCRYCEFDPICPRDRGEMAEAKIADPVLAVRHGLVPEDGA